MVQITKTRRNKYRGVVEAEDGTILLRTPTCETREEAADKLRKGRELILAQPRKRWWKFWGARER